MKRESGKDGDEPRELSRALKEEGIGTGPDDQGKRVEEDWAASGTEDPAFFIKPSEEE